MLTRVPFGLHFRSKRDGKIDTHTAVCRRLCMNLKRMEFLALAHVKSWQYSLLVSVIIYYMYIPSTRVYVSTVIREVDPQSSVDIVSGYSLDGQSCISDRGRYFSHRNHTSILSHLLVVWCLN
jgi:hypothetical protein